MPAFFRRVSVSLAPLSFSLLAALGMACGSEDRDFGPGEEQFPPAAEDPVTTPPGSTDPAVAEKLAEKPWEVVSGKGETLVPNVFYADAAENEQIMPYAIDGHVMIDRLVYPTLGNPNLYVKSDPADELVTVMRVEDEAYAHLGAKLEPVQGSTLSRLNVTNDPHTGFAFLLVPRGSRENTTESKSAVSSGNGTGVVRIYPNAVLANPIPPDMPEVLKHRRTLRFLFKQNAMKAVPPGLYDLRMEIRKDDALYVPGTGTEGIYEYQYNAVRVFDTEPEEHSVINVTDTQVSVGDVYDGATKDRLSELVQYLNTSSDPAVKAASFITFNGDLHNGGSPGSLRQRPVATTYQREAKAIVDALKWLPVPIFLTAGNHDGYVSTGHVPRAVRAVDTAVFDKLESVVADAAPRAWPNFDWGQFQQYISRTAQQDRLGGIHLDLFSGGFARNAKGAGFADGWREVPRVERNYILYDGFYQWQKTYGPLYFSWKFGKSFYVSLNSFELRQHRRSGWGMYTVNYGGGMSDVQLSWLDRELLRTQVTGDDVVLLAHHDPRGGHNGVDPGYYFEQLEYKSVYQSAINYLVGKVWTPNVCKLPDWALSLETKDSCVHDGLQEWMRPDEELDCAWDERKPGPFGPTCDPALFDPKAPAPKSYFFSGLELMRRIAANPQVRTFLLGHTHYNQLEVLQGGDTILPDQIAISGVPASKFASLEVRNPVRAYSFQRSFEPELAALSPATARDPRVLDYDGHALSLGTVMDRNARFEALANVALPRTQRTLDAPLPGVARELVILHLVSNADLANQTQANGKAAFGFGVLHLQKRVDSRAFANAQINRVTFFVNRGSNLFDNLATVDLDRTIRLAPHAADNPLEPLYDW